MTYDAGLPESGQRDWHSCHHLTTGKTGGQLRACRAGSPSSLQGCRTAERGVAGHAPLRYSNGGEAGGGDGGRAHYRGPAGERELRVRPCPDLAGAVLFTTSPLLMDIGDRAVFGRVEQRVRLSRYGGDCYAYCMLAGGHVDLVIETELKPYDVLPLIPIIVGAGGMVTGWDGGSPTAGGRIIAAGDQRIHQAAMALLNK